MRKTLFWSGWVVVAVLPIIYGVQIYLSQDLPEIQPWKWMILIASVLMIIAGRNRDDVLKHHLA